MKNHLKRRRAIQISSLIAMTGILLSFWTLTFKSNNANAQLRKGRKVTSANPVVPQNAPDPHVIRLKENGKAAYYMVHTSANYDISIYRSENLLQWKWMGFLFGGKKAISPWNKPVKLHNRYYCNIWAPEISQTHTGAFMLTFTAKMSNNPDTCPTTTNDSSVFMAWSEKVTGPYAPETHTWEPFPVKADQNCPSQIKNNLPQSTWTSFKDCKGGPCQNFIKLDQTVFNDPLTGKLWMGYNWYTSTPIANGDWEEENQGQHISAIELDPSKPFTIKCDKQNEPVFIANPMHQPTLDRMKNSCNNCGDLLDNRRNKRGNIHGENGFPWGTNEGISFFRKGEYIYALYSGSQWNSKYYQVMWTAAKTMKDLHYQNSNRLVGRFLIPGNNRNFGHGVPVLGPQDKKWYYVHHSMGDQWGCRKGYAGACDRTLWVTPIDFIDRGDGKGAVHIKPLFRAWDKGRVSIDLW